LRYSAKTFHAWTRETAWTYFQLTQKPVFASWAEIAERNLGGVYFLCRHWAFSDPTRARYLMASEDSSDLTEAFFYNFYVLGVLYSCHC
jgi:hypothetical protein